MLKARSVLDFKFLYYFFACCNIYMWIMRDLGGKDPNLTCDLLMFPTHLNHIKEILYSIFIV